MSSQEVSFEGEIELKKLVAYLEDIIAGFSVGKICVQEGEEFVTITPADVVAIKVEVEQKKDYEKFALKLGWSRRESSEQPIQLKISSTEPVVKTKEDVKIDKDRDFEKSSKGELRKKK